MSGEIVQYITDHNAAGDCALAHYQGTHDITRCQLPPGYCSMFAYMAALLKNAESQRPQPLPSAIPYIPPVTESRPYPPGNTGYASAVGSSGGAGVGGTVSYGNGGSSGGGM